MKTAMRWAPAAVLTTAALLTLGVDVQQSVPLRAPLATSVPGSVGGFEGRDLRLSDQEVRVAGVTDYVMRLYERPNAADAQDRSAFSLYVGYYASQARGRTIHSPRNCLPGAGWEALSARRENIETAHGTLTVNRYLLKRGNQRALVLYWYQGRGRTEANEYAVKWDLLRDTALRGRSEEALVRVLVPIAGTEEQAFELAAGAAREAVSAVGRALPT